MAYKSPLKYRSATQLDKYIQDYFRQCDEDKRKYTITGLAVHLGMTRKMLIEYGERETFKKVILTARSRIEQQVEEILLSGKSQAGAIFWLKNAGWTDKQEIEVNDVTELTKDELIERIRRAAGKKVAMHPKNTADTSKKAAAN